MFLGNTFACTDNAYSYMSTPKNEISSISIKNTIVDDLYVSKSALLKFNWEIPNAWNFNIALRANFNDNLYGGNVLYNQDIVTAIKIKRRILGEFTWKTIYEQPVSNNDDFNIEFYDYLEPFHQTIEYAYVAVIGGADMDSISNSVKSEAYSYFIVGANNECYPMILNMDNTITFNRESQIIKSPGSKYPYIVNNGISKYYSGTINVSFFEMDSNCQLDSENAWKYRNKLDQFLTDGNPKIIKSFEGDIWMVNIVNSIPRNNGGDYRVVSQQLEWVECGDPFSIGDLYDNNFINTDVDRE